MTSEGTNLWAKFEILTVLGLYSHISALINMKFGTGERTFAKFHVYRGSVLPLRCEKPIFGLLSENSTGMAELYAGLPVVINFDKK